MINECKEANFFHLRLYTFSIFYLYSIAGFGYFTLFGIGLEWKDTSEHKMNFSERNGHKKALKINSWRISFFAN